MDYREQVFMTVAENLNFTKAAESLFISQPAVTKHIHELESKSGIALFTRKGNRIFLTQAGEIMYNRLRTIENMYNELNYEISTLKGEYEGSLRLGASSTIAQYVIPTVLASFHKRHPNVSITMIAGNSKQVESMLIDNEIDVALVENSSGMQELRYTAFLKDNILAVTNSNGIYAKKGTLNLSELESAPLILREQGSGTLETALLALTEAGVAVDRLNTNLHLGATEAIKNFLYCFDGIAFISEHAITKEFENHSLKNVIIQGLSISRHFRIAERQGPRPKLQSLFIDFALNNNMKL
jgi:DNA-binding transcriptional LysR family regulator